MTQFLAFILIAAQLSVPVNNQQPMVDPPISKATVEIKPGTSRLFLNAGGSEIEVEIKLEYSALQTDVILTWVRRATQAVTTYYGGFPVRHAPVSVMRAMTTTNRFTERRGEMWKDFKVFQECASVELCRKLILRQTGP